MPIAANDNLDPVLWRPPPIVGVVGEGGRVTWVANPLAGAPAFPNDPREA